MLDADLFMKRKATKKISKSRKKTEPTNSDSDNTAFHFIAFVPFGGEVWKLDGLGRQPHTLGNLSDQSSAYRWVIQAKHLQESPALLTG